MKKWIGIAVLASILAVIAIIVFVFEATAFDTRVSNAIQSLRTESLNRFVKIATDAGSKTVEIPIAIIVALWLLIRYRAVAKATVLLGSLLGTYVLNTVLKNLFARPRPVLNRLIEESGYSFPSGHAMVATGFYGFLFYLIWRYFKDRAQHGLATCVTVFAAVWLLLTGLFRVYLGVHYPTDILAAYAGGGIALLLCVIVYHRIRKA